MNKNVPKLRFKEFNDKWRATKLGEVIEYKKGFAFKSKDYTDNGVRVIKISDTTASSVSEEGNTFVKFEMFEEFKEWALKTEDIIISTVGSRPPLYSSMVGKVVKIPEFCNGSLLNQNLVKLVPKDIINAFLYSLLKKTRYTKHIENICRGNANQVSITLEELFDFKVNIPSLQEQEKIADFFTILDSLIEEQDGKVSDLELYKKGMMQKIFSQKIRFKDENGCDYPEWQKYKISDFAERVVRKNKGEESKRPLTISAQYGLVDQQEFFNKTVASQNLEGYYLLENGEFAYNKSYSNGYPFGAIKRLDRYDKGALSTLYICFKPKNNINSDFLVQYFEAGSWHKEISMIAVEGARNHGLLNVAVSDFFETMHKIPCQEEQSKIASCLSNIDDLIKEEQKNLNDLREMKKGLLQQMFV